MDIPKDRFYTKTHEWALPEGDTVLVGITDYAQDALGDVVYVELPEVGRVVEKGEAVAVVESMARLPGPGADPQGDAAEVRPFRPRAG